VNGGNGVLEKQQPGRGDETRRPAEGGAQGHDRSDAPGQHNLAPPAETASQILENGGPPRRSRAAARVGLTTAVVLGVAVAAGIGGLSLLANTGGHGATHRTQAQAAQDMPISGPPLRVVSMLPSAKSAGVSGDTNVEIAFSAKLAPASAAPTFRPAVAGRWQASGSLLSFTPSVPFAASTRYTLVIPAGKAGLRSASGGAITKPLVVRFRTGAYTQLRLAEVLSQLGYLPLTWQPKGISQAGDQPAAGGVVGQEQMAFNPPAGAFTWNSGYPASLRAQWLPDQPNVVVRGAVMAFQSQHQLTINGDLTNKFWRALFLAAAGSQRNTAGYTYAIANKGTPETLTIWHNGHQVLRSLANTGIPIDPTVDGTFPVYERFRFQIMSGTNPGGSHYADPVSFVSYFNGGDAVHYFPRGYYGAPQSLGCVELPYTDAERAWPYLTYGSLVTVAG
jgi:hypothetical protein